MEYLANHRGGLPYLSPGNPRHRVEVDAQLVGMLEVLRPHRVRMELQAREVREPGERRGVARHDLLRCAPRGEAQLDHLDPLRTALRRALLVEELALDPVGIAHQHVGPAARSPKGSFRYGNVIASEVELGMAGLREQHLARVGDRDLAPADREDLFRYLTRSWARVSRKSVRTSSTCGAASREANTSAYSRRSRFARKSKSSSFLAAFESFIASQ